MSRTPNDCQRFLNVVQRCLDETATLHPSELAHTEVCLGCRQIWQAAQLVEIFRSVNQPPTLPDDFANRVVLRAIEGTSAQRGREKLWLMLRLASILAVFVAALQVLHWSVGDHVANAPPPPREPILPTESDPPSDPARSTWTEPGQTVLNTLRRAVDEVLSPTRDWDVGAIRNPTSSALNELDGAALRRSWDKLRSGAETGLEPIGRSTRRALSILTREFLPESARQPDS
ncbi:MAG: hypothetical protein N2039_04940 [Gemmataceae bacterium]|nr:hypothetical protein [Gemmataceae bacterium]